MKIIFSLLATLGAASPAIADCNNDPEEYVCNGDLEQPLNYSATSGNMWIQCFPSFSNIPSPDSDCLVPYWTNPGTNLGRPGMLMSRLASYGTLNFLPQGYSGPGSNSNLDVPYGVGNNIASLTLSALKDGSSSSREEMWSNLKQPMIPGKTYQISYDILITMINDSFEEMTDIRSCLNFEEDSAPNHTSKQCVNQTPSRSSNLRWKHVTFNFTPQFAHQKIRVYGAGKATSKVVINSLAFFHFDNFSVKTAVPTPTPPPTPTPAPPNPPSGNSYNPCVAEDAVAHFSPNPIVSGGTGSVWLEGVNSWDTEISMFDAKGSRVAKWLQHLTTADPKFTLTLPLNVPPGIYFIHFFFPKCWVGSERVAKILVKP